MDLMRRRRLTLLAMCMAQGMILLDITIVNVALPSMQRDLDMTPDRLEWVISAYALTLATLIPFAGTLGDRLGRKRLFLIGLAIFTLASAGCALSTTDLMLIGFRVLEGIGGAVMSALTLSILSEAYPAESRPGAIGIWAAVASVGFSAGPVVGGLLLSSASWGSIFWVNVPVGLLGLPWRGWE
jgi:MFS transporter, DHA2 family, methylenomycin A resistance protein